LYDHEDQRKRAREHAGKSLQFVLGQSRTSIQHKASLPLMKNAMMKEVKLMLDFRD